MSIFFVFDGNLKVVTTEHAEGHNLTLIMILVFISPFNIISIIA